MANRNDSNQPTNANEVRKQNQKSSQKASTPQGNNAQMPSQGSRSEFASETNVNEVTKQNQQSAQQGTATQNNRSEFATDVNEVKKQNQQSAQKKNNASGPQANRSNNSTK